MKRRSPAVQLDGARCESCGRGPAVMLVQLPGTAPFAVCGGCVPQVDDRDGGSAGGTDSGSLSGARSVPRPRAGQPASPPPAPVEDVPPLDWSGEVQLPVDRRELAWVTFCMTSVPGLAAGVWFATGSPVGMVAVGTTAMLVAVTVDRRRLGLPGWGLHRLTRPTGRGARSTRRLTSTPPAPARARSGAAAPAPMPGALLIEEDR